MNTEHFMKDLEFCIDELGISDNDEITRLIKTTDELGVSIRYFFDEFVFIPSDDPTDMFRLHDKDYLNPKWSLN
tara:strand:+ start:255 stop:476 length:222 start_codon:yes stop_codon:yes gene_type:complete